MMVPGADSRRTILLGFYQTNKNVRSHRLSVDVASNQVCSPTDRHDKEGPVLRPLSAVFIRSLHSIIVR